MNKELERMDYNINAIFWLCISGLAGMLAGYGIGELISYLVEVKNAS